MGRSSGFSLIELMATVAVLGIVAAIAIPSLQPVIQNNRAAAITNDLSSALHLARSEAIKRARNVVVCRRGADNACANGADWSVGWLVQTTRPDGTTQVLQVWDAPGGNPQLAGTTNGVTFTPQGAVAATANFALQFENCSGQGRRTLTVALSGHHVLERSDCQ